jgi:hypothetical protein
MRRGELVSVSTVSRRDFPDSSDTARLGKQSDGDWR